MILAIDPGADQGWALCRLTGELVTAGLGQAPMPPDPREISRVIIERPQVYPGRQSEVDPNDLITLAIRVGRQVERYEPRGIRVELVKPREWKGTVDWKVLNNRVLASLSPREHAALDAILARYPQGVRHNVIDAVGLGRWSAGSRRAAHFPRLENGVPLIT